MNQSEDADLIRWWAAASDQDVDRALTGATRRGQLDRLHEPRRAEPDPGMSAVAATDRQEPEEASHLRTTRLTLTGSDMYQARSPIGLRILLADDYRVMRAGLRAIIERGSNLHVIGEADSDVSAVDLARKLAPDVLVGAISLEGVREVRAACGSLRVVALVTSMELSYISNMQRAGAQACVLKESASSELVPAIRAVAEGASYFSPQIGLTFVNCRTRGREVTLTAPHGVPGSRERRVLQLLGEGYTSREIARILQVSPRTVETHRRNIIRKLSARRFAELMKRARRGGEEGG